jgi:putative ABC transport system permease protein
VGVVKDYHYGSVKEKIRPELFTAQPDMPFGRFMVRINPKNKPKTIAAIEQIYRRLSPYRPFKYDFMEDLNYKNYEAEAKWKQMITLAALLSIFVSCIGLFGLTTFSTEARTKEIGIRKVMGASVRSVVVLLSKDFLKLVFIAVAVASPLAYYGVEQWLNNFPYRVQVGWWIFALAGGLSLSIALLTISYQAIRAALMNPVESLKSE